MSHERAQVIEKVKSLVASKFGGDARAAFVHYDRDGDNKINRTELIDLLRDAGIGNLLTRGKWADGVIAEMDKDGDKAISMAELDLG